MNYDYNYANIKKNEFKKQIPKTHKLRKGIITVNE